MATDERSRRNAQDDKMSSGFENAKRSAALVSAAAGTWS